MTFPKRRPAREDGPAPQRRELCNVPIEQARGFLETLAEKKRGTGYVWDHLDGKWAKLNPKQLRPGLAILLPIVGRWLHRTGLGQGFDNGGDAGFARQLSA